MSPRRLGGSSPLTRGKHGTPPACRGRGRLIPAHAGKTVQPATTAQIDAAHPRSRGENGETRLPSPCSSGSSPLTRGKRHVGACRLRTPGLIPAHAGKTCGSRTRAGTRSAHPRSRGENMWVKDAGRNTIGSSPLTRGKLRSRNVRARPSRLIPAHAGKTPLFPAICLFLPAHPRSRGENKPRPQTT